MLKLEDYFDGTELIDNVNMNWSVNIAESYGEDGEVVPGKVDAVIDVWEELRFHSDLDAQVDGGMFDTEGWPTEATQRTLTKVLRDRYNADGIEFDSSNGEPFVAFQMVLSGISADATPEMLADEIWNGSPLMQIHNETDPGTFGSPYLFGTLISGAA